MQNVAKVKGNRWTLLTYFIVALLSVEVVLLTIQNGKLKAMLNTTTPLGQLESLQPGDRVQPIKLQTLDGGTAELRYDDPSKKYLLFVFSTTCPHCDKNLAIWRAIAEKALGDSLNVIGVSIHNLDQTAKYAVEKKPNFYVGAADTAFGRQYKIVGVPETILITGVGSVEGTWVGELSSEQTGEIEGLLLAQKAIAN